MNDDLQTYIEPELEARIVALVLGEASAFEAEDLERLMSKKPELESYRIGLEKVHGVLAEAQESKEDPKWKLSEDRRGKILAKIDEKKRNEMLQMMMLEPNFILMDETDSVADLQSYARKSWKDRAKRMGIIENKKDE